MEKKRKLSVLIPEEEWGKKNIIELPSADKFNWSRASAVEVSSMEDAKSRTEANTNNNDNDNNNDNNNNNNNNSEYAPLLPRRKPPPDYLKEMKEERDNRARMAFIHDSLKRLYDKSPEQQGGAAATTLPKESLEAMIQQAKLETELYDRRKLEFEQQRNLVGSEDFIEEEDEGEEEGEKEEGLIQRQRRMEGKRSNRNFEEVVEGSLSSSGDEKDVAQKKK